MPTDDEIAFRRRARDFAKEMADIKARLGAVETGSQLAHSSVIDTDGTELDVVQSLRAGIDAAELAGQAQATADGKGTVYYNPTTDPPPEGTSSDLWLPSDDGYAPRRWDGTQWVPAVFGSSALADGAVTAQQLADGVVDATKLAEPVSTSISDASSSAADALAAAQEAQTTANDAATTASGAETTANDAAQTAQTAQTDAATALATAQGKTAVSYVTTRPTPSASERVLWFDPNNGYAAQYWDGSTWSAYQYGSGALGDGSVVAGKLAAGSVTADVIVAGAIGTVALAADAITAEKIAAGAIGATELAANSVVAGKISTDAVTAATIAAGSVTTEKIAANAITAGLIDAGAITADKLAANIVLASALIAGNVQLDPTGLHATDADGNPTVSINADGSAAFTGNINGATIEGGLLRTSGPGTVRVEVGSDIAGFSDEIRFYAEASDIASAVLSPFSSGGINGAALTAEDGQIGSNAVVRSDHVGFTHYNNADFNVASTQLSETGIVTAYKDYGGTSTNFPALAQIAFSDAGVLELTARDLGTDLPSVSTSLKLDGGVVTIEGALTVDGGDVTVTTGNVTIEGDLTVTGSITGSSSSSEPSYYEEANGSNFDTVSGYQIYTFGSSAKILGNQGSHFNGSNGTFTAPVSGIYSIFIGGFATTGASATGRIVLQVGKSRNDTAPPAKNESDTFPSLTLATQLYCAAGQVLYFDMFVAGGLVGCHWIGEIVSVNLVRTA